MRPVVVAVPVVEVMLSVVEVVGGAGVVAHVEFSK